MSPPRVLFVSPYAVWHLHTAQEATLAHALRLRGAEMRFALCDGLLPACDVFRANLNPRHASSCLECQAGVAKIALDLKLPYHWLSRYVPRAAWAEVEAWAGALPDEELPRAIWRRWNVGEWARSSALYQDRITEPDWSDPRLLAAQRALVHAAALACLAVSELLDEWRPDVLVTLNGRFLAQRCAIEMARERGLRFLTHERGARKDTLFWRENAMTHELDGYREMWAACKNVALTGRQLADVRLSLDERRAGQNMGWTAYSPPPQEALALRRELDLGEQPLVALFTSSDDEQAAFPEYREGAFPRSLDWLPATLALAPRFPEHVFVLRIHPATLALGRSEQVLRQVHELARQLPPNVRLVRPEHKISSYTLADMAEAGIVYITTLGLEMAARGQPVVSVARGWYGDCGFTTPVARPADYEAELRRALAAGRRDEIAEQALRFAYHYFYTLSRDFPLVREVEGGKGKLNFKDAQELLPGRYAELDRMCKRILGEADGSAEALAVVAEATQVS